MITYVNCDDSNQPIVKIEQPTSDQLKTTTESTSMGEGTQKPTNRTLLIAVIGVVSLLVAIVLGILIYVLIKRRQHKHGDFSENRSISLQKSEDDHDNPNYAVNKFIKQNNSTQLVGTKPSNPINTANASTKEDNYFDQHNELSKKVEGVQNHIPQTVTQVKDNQPENGNKSPDSDVIQTFVVDSDVKS